jgi:hexosaminidase
MDIFPSRYINLGGDEVPLDNYADDKQIPHKILKELILYVKSKGRTAVVWDEALGVAKETGAVVMAWHSLEAGYEALEYGCEVVFCPTSHCYFDFINMSRATGLWP